MVVGDLGKEVMAHMSISNVVKHNILYMWVCVCMFVHVYV